MEENSAERFFIATRASRLWVFVRISFVMQTGKPNSLLNAFGVFNKLVKDAER